MTKWNLESGNITDFWTTGPAKLEEARADSKPKSERLSRRLSARVARTERNLQSVVRENDILAKCDRKLGSNAENRKGAS